MPFLRYPDGQYLTFSVPGAPNDPTIFTYNINDRGVALGVYFCPDDEGSVCGFYGKPGGKITTFTYPPNGLLLFGINNRDEIGGAALLVPTGTDFYIREPDGKMNFFGLNKVKNISSIADDMLSINDRGEAISAYTVLYEPGKQFPSCQEFSYDFIRSPDGKISSYDPPSQPGTLQGVVINNRGVIAGRSFSLARIGLFVLTPKHCDH